MILFVDLICKSNSCESSSFQLSSFKTKMSKLRLNLINNLYLALSFCIILFHDVNSQLYSDPLGARVWECGRQGDEKSSGGQVATPWTVAIYENQDEEFKYIQAGTLVGLQTVVTCGFTHINQARRRLFVRSGLNGNNFEVQSVEDIEPEPLQRSKTWWDEPGGRLQILHLRNPIPISPSSRPICLDPSLQVFEHRKEYHGALRNRTSQENIYLSGYVTSLNESRSTLTAQISPPKRWRIRDWDEDVLSLLETSVTLFGFNWQQHENPYLPRLFNQGSSLVYKKGERWFLLGVSLRSDNHSRTQIRSIEKFTPSLYIKQQCTSQQACSDYYCLPATCDKRFICQCKSYYDVIANCGDTKIIPNERTCQDTGQNETHPITNSEISQVTPSSSPAMKQQTTTTKLHDISRTSRQKETLNNQNTIRCPPIYLSTSTQDIDISCRFQNGSRAGLICSEQYVEVGSTAVLSCTASDRNMKTRCTSNGAWDNLPTNLECIKDAEDKLEHSSSKPKVKDVAKETETIKCPAIELHEGIEIRCSGSLNGTGNDCLRDALKNFYIPLKDTTLEKMCDSTGTWLPRKPFACAIDCGVTDVKKLPFIVHGSKTPSDVWPWHAALFLNVNGTNEYLCGATLISRSILVTAAHCVERAVRRPQRYLPQYKVAIGAISSNYIINLKDEQTQMFNIANVTINPHYNNRSYEGDIALIRLSKPVTLSEFVRPVCFPFPSEKNNQLERYQLSEGNFGYVIGFGTDESWNISLTLKMAKIPYISVRECTRVLERQPTSSQYCAGYTNGTSVCEGDSGGGMFFQDDSSPRRFYIQGVISHGNRDFVNARCDNEKYSVFTRVGAFNDWVQSVVDSLEYDYQ